MTQAVPSATANTYASEFTERWTTQSGIRIRYLDNGGTAPGSTSDGGLPGRNLPVLFVPGLTDFAEDYVALLQFFLPRRVLVVEVRGRGKSEAPPTGYSVADHVSDLRAVLDQEGLEQVHLMTFSRGTSWSLELAMEDPHRFASMSIGDYQAVEIGMSETFPDTQWALRFRGVPIPERVHRHVLDGIQRDSRSRSLWHKLAELPLPVLVAYGDQPGSLIDAEALERFRSAVPSIEIVRIPGASHDIFRIDRLAYPRAVATFIDKRFS